MTPYLVKHNEIDLYFPAVAHHLEKAIKHNRCSGWTVPSLYQSCATRGAYLVVDDAQDPKNALTFRLEQWDGEQVCMIMFLGGEGGMDWAKEIPAIKTFVADLGVTRIVSWMRDGWKRKLKTKRLATLCEIEVES